METERERVCYAWWPTWRGWGLGWLWRRHYVVRERLEPDNGGWSTGVWVVVSVTPLPELDHAH